MVQEERSQVLEPLGMRLQEKLPLLASAELPLMPEGRYDRPNDLSACGKPRLNDEARQLDRRLTRLHRRGDLQDSPGLIVARISGTASEPGPSLVPRHDRSRAPQVGAAEGLVRLRHLAAVPVGTHRADLDAEVLGDLRRRPPLRLWIRARHTVHSACVGRSTHLCIPSSCAYALPMSTSEQASDRDWQGLAPDTDPTRPTPIDWQSYADEVMSQWYDLLKTDPEESAVQDFLELHPAMIPGGSGDVGPGGHHGSEMSAVFRRPALAGAGPSYEPDFMWVTRSSGLITPILIEIEKPGKRWFQKNGRPTADFRDAHDQLNDWRSWFARDDNRRIFRDRFLFRDSYSDRPLEPQFVLIYGRAFEFERGGGHLDPRSIRHKRESQRAENETFMTFDALRPRYDHGRSVTLTMTVRGPRPFAFSPCYGTGTHSGPAAVLLGDPTEALSRSVMISDERKAYISRRWNHWRDIELSSRAGVSRIRYRKTGIE